MNNHRFPTFKIKLLCKYEAKKLSLGVFGMLKCIVTFSYGKYLRLS